MTRHDAAGSWEAGSLKLASGEAIELHMLAKRRNWPATILVAALLLAIVGFLSYHEYPYILDWVAAAQLQPDEQELAALQSQEPSPFEKAGRWQEENLAGTAFENLPIQEQEGRFYVVYTAAKGDSLSKIVKRYGQGAGIAAGGWEVVLTHAREHHEHQYGRGLWSGDDVLLLLPLSREPAR